MEKGATVNRNYKTYAHVMFLVFTGKSVMNKTTIKVPSIHGKA